MVRPLRETIGRPIKDLGLLEEFGLPEPDDVIPSPIELMVRLGLPTPKDIILNAKAAIDKGIEGTPGRGRIITMEPFRREPSRPQLIEL